MRLWQTNAFISPAGYEKYIIALSESASTFIVIIKTPRQRIGVAVKSQTRRDRIKNTGTQERKKRIKHNASNKTGR